MTTIANLPPHQKSLAYQIISEADLPADEDAAIRAADHDFEEGIGWGLQDWVAARRGITHDEAVQVIR